MCETLDFGADLPAVQDRPRYLDGGRRSPSTWWKAVWRGGRYVRLRPADPVRPPRPGLDAGWTR